MVNFLYVFAAVNYRGSMNEVAASNETTGQEPPWYTLPAIRICQSQDSQITG